jgi:hypothetical protein
VKYLCLIHLDAAALGAMPEAEVSALNARHLELNRRLHASGHFIEAEALDAGSKARTVRVRDGRTSVTDGPFTETKELVAGFYLIDAADMDEAVDIASRIPAAPLGTIEVWPTRQLIVDGVARPALG